MVKKPPRKDLKPPGRCIFCGGLSGARLSREHVLPNWLRELFPRTPEDTHTHGVTSWVGLSLGAVAPITIRHRKQGHVSTKKVRVVCEKCNNEWLSSLENRTKSLLLPTIRGEKILLDRDNQLLLATWAAKTIMTAEFVDRTKIAVPQADRTSLMQNVSVPSAGWWIWIAGNQGAKWETGIYHFSARLNVTPADLKTPDILNIQCTTIGIGRLLIHAISTTVSSHSFALTNPTVSDLKPIWPQPTAPISWPPSKFQTDDQVEVIARNLQRAFRVPVG